MTMEQSLCTSTFSRVNIANYLQRTTSVSNFAPSQSLIRIISEHGRSTIVPVESRFRCIGRYTRHSSSTVTQTSDYLTDSYSGLSGQTSTSSLCGWDDDQTYPPSPAVENGTCTNAVVDVNYEIQYNNTRMLKLVATYIMADIPLEVSDTVTYTKTWYEDVIEYQSSSTTSSATNVSTTTSPSITTTSTVNDTYTIVRTQRSSTVTVTGAARPVTFASRYKATFRAADLTENTVTYSGKPGRSFKILVWFGSRQLFTG